MKIAFYAPMKPLGHSNPSGDLVIATGLVEYLRKQGHRLEVSSSLRARWIFWKPWRWPSVLRDRGRSVRRCRRNVIDVWLTYHTYYKSPDLLGPYVSRRIQIPYVVFQGMYATQRKKNWRTLPGFILNRWALQSARHVFTNRREDFINLKRLLPESRLSYVAPGIYPDHFYFSASARETLRSMWGVENRPVILTAAMFRPGVKAEGLSWVIQSCARLSQQGARFHLVIAGDGKEKRRLKALAEKYIPEQVHFAGKIPRQEMYRFYSAGDLFVFPGIRESLGMVYLEAQACGLPVVAFDNGGIPEVVQQEETGFLVPLYASEPFVQAIHRLMRDKGLREKMGRSARVHVRRHHNLDRNYRMVENVLSFLSCEK